MEIVENENQLMIKQMVRDFAEKEIRPKMMEWDESQEFPVPLFKKLGDKVEKGERLYRIHALFPADFNFAIALCERDSSYLIGTEDQIPKAFVEF